MSFRRRFAVVCTLTVSSMLACSSVERTAPDASAGSAGENHGGAGGSSAGTGAAGGQTAAGGKEPTAGGASGAASAGTGAGGSGDTGGATNGAAGMGPAAAGEAGATGTMAPPPLLQNGSFESGGLFPWQILETPDVGKAIYTQWPDGKPMSIDGAFEVSFWNGTAGFKGDLHQTISGLVPGKYELKLYIAYGAGINAAYLYAIGCGPTDVHVDLPLDVGVPSFAPVSIPSIDVTGDTCTVGLFADMNTGDWLNADAFVFDALPTP